MAENSKIEWTDDTGNLWWGCQRAGAGCVNCYAAVFANRLGFDLWDGDTPRKLLDCAFSQFHKFERKAVRQGRVRKVFVGSMMDIFEKPKPLVDKNLQPIEGITTGDIRDKFFKEIVPSCPNLQLLFLTKRTSNIPKYIPESWKNNPPQNVMFGATMVNQKDAITVMGHLSKVNGKKFVSIEPQLGEISLMAVMKNGQGRLIDHIDWVINGGESGDKRRPFNTDWARKLRDECKANNTPFFFKQVDKVKPIPKDLKIRNCA